MLKGMGGGGKGFGKRRGGSMIGRTVKKDKDRVVWIGGFKERETKDRDLNKQLQEFINKKAEGCKFVDIGRKGKGKRRGSIIGANVKKDKDKVVWIGGLKERET